MMALKLPFYMGCGCHVCRESVQQQEATSQVEIQVWKICEVQCSGRDSEREICGQSICMLGFVAAL